MSFRSAPLFQIFSILQDHKLTSSSQVNVELSKVISLLLRDFISSWFQGLSPDQELYHEIVSALSSIIQEAERRLSRVDWVGLLSQDVPAVLSNHIRDFRSCSRKMGTSYGGGKTFEELFYGLQSHVALESEESEKEYLRRVSELLLDALLPDHELQSDAIKMLIREVLCNNVLLNLIEVLSDPDWLNETILLALNPELAEITIPENGEHGYQSDMSEASQFAEDNEIVERLFAQDSASSKLGETDSTKKPQDATLFKIKGSKPSFLKRRSFATKRDSNLFTNGLNKLTFGGLEKVTNSIDKIKEYVNDTPKRRKKKERDSSRVDYESDVDLSDTNSPGIPSGNLVTPTLQVEETNGEITTLSQTAEYAPNLTYDPDVSIPPVKKESVKFSEKVMEREITPVLVEPIDIWESIKLFVNELWRLHRETINGPRKLGPINTAIYERSRLEDNFVELFSEIFEFNYRQNWIYTQLHFFIKPLVVGLVGHIINRSIIKMTYHLIDENSVSFYLKSFRLSFWPNNQPAPPYMVKSESEKVRIRELLERTLVKIVSGTAFVKIQALGEKIQGLVDVFQNKRINKHLLFIAIDLILIHLIPEQSDK